MLVSLLGHFDNVYLVVDAIDEFPKSTRHNLLKVVSGLRNLQMDSLHLFVSSMPEVDIGKLFRAIPPTIGYFRNFTLDQRQVQDDILMYLDRRLYSDACRKWSEKERIQVRKELSSEADGMYVIQSCFHGFSYS